MNLYIIVEGAKTEMRAYPEWLATLLPELSRVDDYQEVEHNNYYLFSAGGIPSIYNHLVHAAEDITGLADRYDYLLVCIDSEDLSLVDRKVALEKALKERNFSLPTNCKLEVIVHKHCIESWFLGNRRVCSRAPESECFRALKAHYDVGTQDPEEMPLAPNQTGTVAQFHAYYLREMLKEKNMRYTKANPSAVLTTSYFQEMKNRTVETGHLDSFRQFLTFCEQLKEEL